MRSASPTPSCPIPPALSTSSTTVAPLAEASSSIPFTKPSRGRSSVPSTLMTSTEGSAAGCAFAATAGAIDAPRTPTNRTRRSAGRAFMDVPSYRPPRGILALDPHAHLVAAFPPDADASGLRPVGIQAGRLVIAGAGDRRDGRAGRHRDRASVRGHQPRREAARQATASRRRELHPDPPDPAALHDLRERREDRPRPRLSGQSRDRAAARDRADRARGGPRARGFRLLRPRGPQPVVDVARPGGQHPRQGVRPGRLDDHPATGEAHARDPQQPVDRAQVPRGRVRDAGRAEVFEEPDPGDVPERGLPREQPLWHGHGGAVLLPRAGLQAHAAPSGAARRIDPEPVRLRPDTAPAPGVPAAQRRRQQDDRARSGQRGHHDPTRSEGEEAAARARQERRRGPPPDATVHRRLREAADRRRPERLVLIPGGHAGSA